MLRTLILTTAIGIAVLARPALPQNLPSEATHGDLMRDALKEAETLGADLKSRLELIQREFDLPIDLGQRGVDSIGNERVRELLAVPDAETIKEDHGPGRYDGGVFLFASFSIPDPSLRALLHDASELGVPVYFNGFVDNSTFATEARVRALYEEGSETHGFGIDPTLFERFDIEVVPTLVATTEPLDVCESTKCDEDATPGHDRVSGNIPLRTALKLLAEGDGAHSSPAAKMLEGD